LIELGSAREWKRDVTGAGPLGTHSRSVGLAKRRAAPTLDTVALNREFADADATRVIEWAARTFREGLVVSTSFGIQSAAFLHLVTQVVPGIPVVWVDTGYLPPETLRFADRLSERLQLNLETYRSSVSPAQMERDHGKLWARNDVESLNLYDRIRKLEPMRRALSELDATAWLAGLRADQTDHRKALPRIGRQSDRFKLLPILHWTTRDVHAYLRANDLPYHPLFDQGYATVGDWHSSRPVSADDDRERDSRFHGLKQECGLHLPDTPGLAESLTSSQL
jgi:phosphoadenosine phosphosulfate reductase